MSVLNKLADLITRAVTLIACLGVLVMMLHVCTDVGQRAITGRPLPGTVEIVSRYYMVAIAFLPLIWAERRGSMVTVEMLDHVMGPRMLWVSDMLVAALSTAVYWVLCWTTWRIAMSNFETRSFVTVLNEQLPIWPTYLVPPVGFFLAGVATLIRMLARSTADEAKI